jgi:CRISPR system Cascade subunit CasB
MIGDPRLALRWWEDLRDEKRGDRGALARLRRAATVFDAATEPATIDLCRKLGLQAQGLEQAALVAAVLAHVRENVPGKKMARQLGAPDSKTPAVMSWLRFRRLMQFETPDELLTGFRRAIALAKGNANVVDLAGALLNWNDQRRREWIYAYHDANIAQPNINSMNEEPGESQS